MKTFLRLSLFCLVFLSMFSCRSVFEWQSKGPINNSGPVRQIIVDKNDSNKLYAATENGGVWVNSDYTDVISSWRPLTDKLENLQTRGFDVSQRDSNTMVMGNGLGNLHLSRNGGDSWSKIDVDSFGYIRKIAIDDVLGTILVFNVASSNGLFKIEVRGNGQNPIVTQQINQSKEILDFVIDRASKRQNVRYYAARNDGVYKSVDFGATWKRVLNSDSSSAMIKIAQPARDGSTVIKDGRQLFANVGTGTTFDSINRPPDNARTASNSDVGYRNTFGGRAGDWNHAIAINPTNSDEIVFGTFRPFFSNDNGSTWAGVGFGHEDLHDIVYVNNDVLTATDGGVIKLIRNSSGNLVSGHQYLNNGLNTFQFYRMAVNGNTAVGNADHNGIKYTENLNSENPNWEDVFDSGYGDNGLENDFIHKDIKNPARTFVAYRDLSLLRLNIPYSSNRNNDLLEHHDSIVPVRPYTRFIDNDNCVKKGISYDNCNQYYNGLNYAIGTLAQDPNEESNTMLLSSYNSRNNARSINAQDEFYIKKSMNAHLNPTIQNPTWTISHRNGNIPVVSIAYSTDNNGKAYALDESGKFIINNNVDNDDIWSTPVQIPLSHNEETMRQLIVDQNNTSNLFATSHEHIYQSTNEGAGWTVLPFSLVPNSKINTITQHHKNFDTYFIGTSRGVYRTTNSGLQWSLFGEDLPNAEIMQIFVEGKFLYAVSFGRGLWRTDLENPKRVFIGVNR